jgi:hypothetical protein
VTGRGSIIDIVQACAPWCAYQSDPDFFDEGGNCASYEMHTDISLDQQGPAGDYSNEGHDFVNVYACRRPGQRDVVYVGHNHLPGIELTASEAREVIEHMQLVLGQIEGAR